MHFPARILAACTCALSKKLVCFFFFGDLIFCYSVPSSFQKCYGKNFAQDGQHNDWRQVITRFVYFLWCIFSQCKQHPGVDFSRKISSFSCSVVYVSNYTVHFLIGMFHQVGFEVINFYFFLIVDTKAMKRWIGKKRSDEYLKIINNSFGQLDHTIEFDELFWVWFSIITLCRWLSYPSFLLPYLSVNVFFTFITWSKLWNRLKMIYDFITL